MSYKHQFKISFFAVNLIIYISIHLSPRRLGLLFFLDKKQKQKNQDWLRQPCNAAPTAHIPSHGYAPFHLVFNPLLHNNKIYTKNRNEKRNSKTYIIYILFVLITLLASWKAPFTNPVKLKYPNTWPKPTYDFSKNPLTEEGIQLGRKLFYDPLLSKDNTISCSSCHLSYTAFTHVDHKLSHGINDSIGNRNSLALMNLAWNKSFMWDGSANHLDMQALAPISDPKEMGSSIVEVVEKLQSSEDYPTLFNVAFGDTIITGTKVLKAMSQFQLTLISSNSKYDKVMNKTDEESFTDQEQNGYEIYTQHCASCHAEPLFSTGEFANNGLSIDQTLHDIGRMTITQNPSDSLSFKIPSLRNLKYSFPYMHDGRFSNLNEVINHYTEVIDPNGFVDSRLSRKISLTSNEKVDLVAFLLTLNDREFVFNKEFAFLR